MNGNQAMLVKRGTKSNTANECNDALAHLPSVIVDVVRHFRRGVRIVGKMLDAHGGLFMDALM